LHTQTENSFMEHSSLCRLSSHGQNTLKLFSFRCLKYNFPVFNLLSKHLSNAEFLQLNDIPFYQV
jgi:hypothetical protein